MINCVFNPYKKWLLTGLLAIAPFLAIEANSDDSSNLSASIKHVSRSRSSHREGNKELRFRLELLLDNQTVYFHDYAFSVLGGFPPEFAIENDAHLRQNAAAIAEATSSDPIAIAQATALLIAYITAGENYVNIVNATLDDPTNPIVAAALQQWLDVSDQVAAALHQLNPKVISLNEAQRLLTSYTLLLADMVNNLAPTSFNNPDFTRASELYIQAQILTTEELAPLIAKAVTKSKHRRRFF